MGTDREDHSEDWGAHIFDRFVQDLAFAMRQFRRNPGFAFTAIIVLSLGIAASSVLFNFIDAAVIRPLPYYEPSRLVGLFERIPVGDRFHLSYGDYLDWKQLNHVFSSLDAYQPFRFTVVDNGRATTTEGARVSAGFFDTLGVRPILGRDFRSGEDLRNSAHIVLLSNQAWVRRYGADKSVVGKTITLQDKSYFVAGVLPPEFHFAPLGAVEFWTTIAPEDCADSRGCHAYYAIARLKPGISLTGARDDLASIANRIALSYPKTNRDRSATIIPITDLIIGDFRQVLFALFGGAALLLLIGFVNVSTLLVVRSEARRREIALREAFGASRIRLVQQFCVEGFLLAGCGCIIGAALAILGGPSLLALIPSNIQATAPYLRRAAFNGHTFVECITVSFVAGLLFSFTPALHTWLSRFSERPLEGGRTVAGHSWRRLGSVLVISELTIATVLVAGACLLTESAYRLVHTQVGIEADHLAVVHVAVPAVIEDPQIANIADELPQHISHIPGVLSSALVNNLAIGSGDGFAHFRVAGKAYIGQGDEALERYATPGYFDAVRTRLVRGEYFSDLDGPDKPRVAVINQTGARFFFPNENPVGKRLIDEYDPDHPIQVVGVIDDIQEGALDAEHRAAIYSPFKQGPTSDFYIVARTSIPPDSVLSAMSETARQVDLRAIIESQETMSDRISDSQAAYLHRSSALIATGFASLALLLGIVGIYGVISFSVGHRTREIGVRMALGARKESIYKLVLWEAALLVLSGVSLGICLSLVAANLLRTLLYATAPWDIKTLVLSPAILGISALAASYLPARRAASVHPSEALRAE